MDPDHCQKLYPGTISNDDLILKNDKFLTSGGEQECAEDIVVDPKFSERLDYKIISAELWGFLVSRYNGTEIKRFSIRQNSFSTIIEVKLPVVNVLILPVASCKSGAP